MVLGNIAGLLDGLSGFTVTFKGVCIPVHIGAVCGHAPLVHPNVLLVPPSAIYQPGGQV